MGHLLLLSPGLVMETHDRAEMRDVSETDRCGAMRAARYVADAAGRSDASRD
jgi:hypothetical protein